MSAIAEESLFVPKLSHHHRHESYRGFTLIELLVVIAIIGLLASIVLVSLNRARAKARAARAAADLDQIRKVLAMYLDDNNVYPCHDHDWRDCRERSWSATYMSQWPKTPWNTEYHLEHGFGSFPYAISIRDVPLSEAQLLDRIADDNNLSSGIIRGGASNPTRVEFGATDTSVPFVDTYCAPC